MSQVYTWPPISATAPVGGATSANQVLEIAQLTDINANTTGIATAANQVTGNSSLSAIETALTTGPVPVSAASLPLPTGAATSALQTSGNSSLTTIASNTTGLATAANQSTMITDLATIASNTAGISQGASTAGQPGYLELAAVSTSSPSYSNGVVEPLSLTLAGALRTDSSAITQPISAASLPLPTGASTEATISARLSGSLVPTAYDETVITYVGATTAIATVVYKLATVTVKTLTMTYDGSNRLIDVVAT